MDLKASIALCSPPTGKNHGAGGYPGFPVAAFHAKHAPTGLIVRTQGELDELTKGWQIRSLTEEQKNEH